MRRPVAIPKWVIVVALVVFPMWLVWSAIPTGQPNKVEAIALVGVFWLAILWACEQKGLF